MSLGAHPSVQPGCRPAVLWSLLQCQQLVDLAGVTSQGWPPGVRSDPTLASHLLQVRHQVLTREATENTEVSLAIGITVATCRRGDQHPQSLASKWQNQRLDSVFCPLGPSWPRYNVDDEVTCQLPYSFANINHPPRTSPNALVKLSFPGLADGGTLSETRQQAGPISTALRGCVRG